MKLIKARESESFEAQLHLHPGRHQLNNIVSANAATKSLVCQVTIPKLIGRRRKRKNSEHQDEIEPHGLNEQQMLTVSLKDHGPLCDFQFLGEYTRVHKFRTMPDFVFSLQRNRFMQKFHKNVAPLDYERSKLFKLDENEDFEVDTDLVPPPSFSPHTIPFNYAYQQNISVKVVVGDDGGVEMLNEGAARRSLVPRVAFDIDHIPAGPPTDIPSLDQQPPGSSDLIKKLHLLFAKRPIWTRRAIYYHLQGNHLLTYLKWLLGYIGYEFETGPWSSTIIRYGVDPRSDPEFRIYQSITLHFDPETSQHLSIPIKGRKGGTRATKKVQRNDKNGIPGYIFTGKTLVTDGKTWQVCDIQDSLLRAILLTQDLRSECDIDSRGWFKNGTWTKAKIIFRYKVRAIVHQDSAWTEEDFVHACQMPDEFDPMAKDLPVDTKGWSRRAILLAYHIKQNAQGFGKNRSQWTTHDVSTAVMQALRQHDDESNGEAVDLDETFEEMLEEEGNLLNDHSGSASPDSSDEALDSEDAEGVEDMEEDQR